ncbi:C3HC zinc finger-like-domain-containing protein [Fennellomyces sp. T-0311]|nr:C3HC zinc finger-like-domain-containing protein [Fennellomyces sp. T-0311]
MMNTQDVGSSSLLQECDNLQALNDTVRTERSYLKRSVDLTTPITTAASPKRLRSETPVAMSTTKPSQDRDAFYKRLETFSSAYVGRARPVSAVECAMHGFIDTHVVEKKHNICKLSCTLCNCSNFVVDVTGYERDIPKTMLKLREQYVNDLSKLHCSDCFWKYDKCADDIYAFPIQTSTEALDLMKTEGSRLMSFPGRLPTVQHPLTSEQLKKLDMVIRGTEHLTEFQPTLQDIPDSERAPYIYALFGWRLSLEDFPSLKCHQCFKWVPNSARSQFDVVSEHMEYCPWVNRDQAMVRRPTGNLGFVTGYEWMVAIIEQEYSFLFYMREKSEAYQEARINYIKAYRRQIQEDHATLARDFPDSPDRLPDEAVSTPQAETIEDVIRTDKEQPPTETMQELSEETPVVATPEETSKAESAQETREELSPVEANEEISNEFFFMEVTEEASKEPSPSESVEEVSKITEITQEVSHISPTVQSADVSLEASPMEPTEDISKEPTVTAPAKEPAVVESAGEMSDEQAVVEPVEEMSKEQATGETAEEVLEEPVVVEPTEGVSKESDVTEHVREVSEEPTITEPVEEEPAVTEPIEEGLTVTEFTKEVSEEPAVEVSEEAAVIESAEEVSEKPTIIEPAEEMPEEPAIAESTKEQTVIENADEVPKTAAATEEDVAKELNALEGESDDEILEEEHELEEAGDVQEKETDEESGLVSTPIITITTEDDPSKEAEIDHLDDELIDYMESEVEHDASPSAKVDEAPEEIDESILEGVETPAHGEGELKSQDEEIENLGEDEAESTVPTISPAENDGRSVPDTDASLADPLVAEVHEIPGTVSVSPQHESQFKDESDALDELEESPHEAHKGTQLEVSTTNGDGVVAQTVAAQTDANNDDGAAVQTTTDNDEAFEMNVDGPPIFETPQSDKVETPQSDKVETPQPSFTSPTQLPLAGDGLEGQQTAVEQSVNDDGGSAAGYENEVDMVGEGMADGGDDVDMGGEGEGSEAGSMVGIEEDDARTVPDEDVNMETR